MLNFIKRLFKFDNLWEDIIATSQPSENNSIEIPVLRRILKRHGIL